MRLILLCLLLLMAGRQSIAQTTLGGVNLGNLPQYLFVFTDGSGDANWQSASKGFVGDVAVYGTIAAERTSGSFAYAGTIKTNDATLSAWQTIVNNNAGQATGSTGNTTLLNDLRTSLNNAFTQINALPATAGYTSVASTDLNGLNTQNGIAQTFVINVTSGLSVSSQINITGDANDIFILRWDTDANFSDGYEGQVKFQSGGAIIPNGGLKATNFIHVAGDINSSGGGSNPPSPYPQGPRLNNGTGALITGASDFSGGGFFTGYWLTTGSPVNAPDANHSVRWGESSSLSNGIFVGGWYSINSKFSMTSGTSGVYVSPPSTSNCVTPNAGPDQTLACTNNQLPTSFDLVDAQAGQKWKIVSPVPPGANITVTTPSGAVSGTIVAGTYTFRLQNQSDSLNCFDEVKVIVQSCNNGGFENQICYVSPTKPAQVSAKQEWTVNQAAGTVTIRTTFAKTFVDNTYGTNAIGWPGGHSFGNLDGSDKLQLSLRDGNGIEKMNLTLDYIDKNDNIPSGYETGGVAEGEGKVDVGNEADVVNVKTSLSENLNTFGYVLTTNSPATDANYTPNPTYPNWIYDVWYEVTVKLSAFGAAGFGTPTIEEVHASPSKTGNNTEVVVPNACPIFDLALDKKVKPGQPSVFAPGQNVTFTITVYNQGNAAATNITVTDYIPAGLTLNDANWSTPSGSKTTRNIASLAPGASTTLEITFQIQAGVNGNIVNKAEVSSASGGNDVDSTPDNIDGNQPGETGNQLKDNVITENGKNGGDEDDHDIAIIAVSSDTQRFDLALLKKLKTGQSANVSAGNVVTFTIVVYNQGNIPASNVVVTDYIPSGLTMIDGNWTTPSAGKTTRTIASLAAGASQEIDISFVVNSNPPVNIVNKAEISSATGGTDIDSTPDNIDGNTPGETGNQIKDNVITENGNIGGDEDDHDFEKISTCVNTAGGPDLSIASPTTSANLPDAPSGQSWSVLSQPAGASASITTPAGVVTGMTVDGTYRFLLTGVGGCNDTVSIFRGVNGGEICYTSPTKPSQVSAKQEWTVNQAAGTVTIRTTFAKTFVDNTYGTNAIGWPGGHSFGNLEGSDKLELSLKDANGVEKMNLTLDYIDKNDNIPSGYETGGVAEGEGKVDVGNEADVVNVKTSLSENLNTFGYVLTTNSPATNANYTPNPTYPNWIFDVWYEVTVKLSAFGAAGFGYPTIEEVHASPSKTGSNTEDVVPGSCPVASAQGGAVCVGNSITLQSSSAPNGATIQWTGPNGFSSTQPSPVINNATLANAGVYTLTVTFNNISDTDTAIVQVFNKPAKPVASFTSPACLGDTLKLFASAEAGVSYTWKGPNGFVSGTQNPIITNLTAAASGDYILTVSKNGCTASDTVKVTVINCCPVITTTDSKDTLCSGYYGEFFIANYTDLGSNGIKFVMFTSPQTGSSMYTGGTVVTPSSFSNGVAQWPIGQPGSQFPANNGTSPVNYYVYAILSTTPTDPQCRPFAEKIYTILPLPSFTATPQPACAYDNTFGLNIVIPTAGTYNVVLQEISPLLAMVLYRSIHSILRMD